LIKFDLKCNILHPQPSQKLSEKFFHQYFRVELPELTSKIESKIAQTFAISSQTQTVAELDRHQCTAQDLRTLNGLKWLNDEVC
jgi:Ulp1 family protease